MIYQLEKNIADTLKEFFNQFDFIDKVVVFGSRARHDCTPKSDIDLCIYSLEMTDIQFSKLKFEIDELPILYKLDVVHFEKVNKELQDNVERDGKLLFKKYVKLEDVSLNSGQYGSNSKAVEYDSNKPRYLRITDIDNNGKLSDKKVSPSKIEEKYYLNKNDFLFARSGSVGRTYLHDKNAEELQFAGYLIKYILDLEKIYPKFLFYFTKSEIYNNWIEGNKNTVAQTNINAKQFLSLIFPLPTLTKQKKIANALDKVSELITLRKESIKKLDELSKSIFIDMFGEPISNPKEWKLKELGEVCEITSSKRIYKSDYVSDGIPFYKIKEIILKSKNIKPKKIEYISTNTFENFASKFGYPKEGDILATAVGATIGYFYLVDNEKFYFKDGNLIWLRNYKIDINKKFLIYLFRTEEFINKILEVSKGAAQNALTIVKLKLLTIYLPPLELQNKFATIIEKIEEQKALYEKELKLLENNFDSLLDESFN